MLRRNTATVFNGFSLGLTPLPAVGRILSHAVVSARLAIFP
jgi:hypothetical protein